MKKEEFYLGDKLKSLKKLSLISVIYTFIVFCVILITGISNEWKELNIFYQNLISLGIAFLIAVFALIFSILKIKVLEEKSDKEALKKRKSVGTFEATDDIRYSVKQTFLNYKKYAPYVVSILGIIITFSLLSFSSPLPLGSRLSLITINEPVGLMFVSIILMLTSFFLGVFYVGQSRIKEFRVIYSVGAWLLSSSLFLGLTFISALLFQNEFLEYSHFVYITAVVINSLLGIEFLLSLISEFYRPRVNEDNWRPLFDSKILALFTEPGGVLKNIANTLDYQFGFSISNTSLYSFFEKKFVPMVVLWAFLLWGLTSIYEVDSNELGFREVLGKIVKDENGKPIEEGPGIKFKYPWPFEKIRTIKVEEIKEIEIGHDKEAAEQAEGEHGDELDKSNSKVILWTSDHFDDANYFIVANQKDKNQAKDDKSVSLSALMATFPIQYKVRKSQLYNYAYLHKNPDEILEKVSRREIMKCLVGADMLKVISYGREEITKELQKTIQKEADKLKLGIDIVSVNFHGAHPPIEGVAPAFQNVIAAKERKEVALLEAKKYQIEKESDAKIAATKLSSESISYRDNKIKIANAESKRFLDQYKSYKAMPNLFKLKAYLSFLEKYCKNTRKYIVSDGIDHEIYEINLEESARLDILDADFE